ncbi:MAG: efflux RND transporter periplasmic adaptor subunit [Marinilabiliales bacterium]|nr:MAG: efflux RND transporter periplasmic adaptor subunit [Marinilabiliales bacterium]
MEFKSKLKGFMTVAAVILTAYGCSSSPGDEAGTATEAGDRTEAVRVLELGYSEIARSINYTANLRAFTEVHLAPAQPGRVDRIHVEAGDRIGRGQLLVEMDRTQLQQARLQLAGIEKDYRRMDTLRKVGSVTRQQYDQVKTQYEMAESNVAFLMENTTLTAPFDGRVSAKYFENGEMFSGAPNTPAGKAAIITLVHTSRLKVMINVSERYYRHISEGISVEITTDVWPGEVFMGTVKTVYPTIDPATRTFTVEMVVPNSDERLRPGMFARATMELEQIEAFVVPALAVLKLQGSNERFVFIEENGRARRVAVGLGERFDDMVEIISDELSEGDRLIFAGQARLVDGVAVEVQW